METWREVARRHGFCEFDGPTLESLDLYARKNAGGEEILGQLYRFEDAGGRSVALRPEMTPTLARLVAAHEKDFRKPIKWFSVGSCFRFERQQRGRLREFLQFNCDILGEEGSAADAELLALAINTLRAFGLGRDDVVVRLSHRGAWADWMKARGIEGDAATRVLQVIDKLERDPEEVLINRLDGIPVSIDDLRSFIGQAEVPALEEAMADLRSRGLDDFVTIDLSIVRGLAYYTGFVFEVFDRSLQGRAIAGGGRYDGLVKVLGGGKADLPAVGFGMGDVVLANLIDEKETARSRMAGRCADRLRVDVYVVIADGARRGDALKIVQSLRESGLRVEMPFGLQKVGKQFQAAEQSGAETAVILGSEWPNVKVKSLADRVERELPHGELADFLKTAQPA